MEAARGEEQLLELPPPFLRYHNAPPSLTSVSMGRAPLVTPETENPACPESRLLAASGGLKIPRMPTADELAVAAIPESFRCPLCLDVLDQPVTTIPCGHTFCEGCILRSLEDMGEVSLPSQLPGSSPVADVGILTTLCPVCRARVRKDHLGPCWIVRDLVGNILIRCDYGVSYNMVNNTYESGIPGGCTSTFKLSDRVSHLQDCSSVLVPCQFLRDGCDVIARRGDIGVHEGDCPFRSQQCVCGARVVCQFLEDHKKLCPNVVVSCPHQSYGCSVTFLRGTLNEHLALCPYEAVKDLISAKDAEIQRLLSENLRLEAALWGAQKAVLDLEHCLVHDQAWGDVLLPLKAAKHHPQRPERHQQGLRSRSRSRSQQLRFSLAEDRADAAEAQGERSPRVNGGCGKAEGGRAEAQSRGRALNDENEEDAEREPSDVRISEAGRWSLLSGPAELDGFPPRGGDLLSPAEKRSGSCFAQSRQLVREAQLAQRQSQLQQRQRWQQREDSDISSSPGPFDSSHDDEREEERLRSRSRGRSSPTGPKPWLPRTVSSSPRRGTGSWHSRSLRDMPTSPRNRTAGRKASEGACLNTDDQLQELNLGGEGDTMAARGSDSLLFGGGEGTGLFSRTDSRSGDGSTELLGEDMLACRQAETPRSARRRQSFRASEAGDVEDGLGRSRVPGQHGNVSPAAARSPRLTTGAGSSSSPRGHKSHHLKAVISRLEAVGVGGPQGLSGSAVSPRGGCMPGASSAGRSLADMSPRLRPSPSLQRRRAFENELAYELATQRAEDSGVPSSQEGELDYLQASPRVRDQGSQSTGVRQKEVEAGRDLGDLPFPSPGGSTRDLFSPRSFTPSPAASSPRSGISASPPPVSPGQASQKQTRVPWQDRKNSRLAMAGRRRSASHSMATREGAPGRGERGAVGAESGGSPSAAGSGGGDDEGAAALPGQKVGPSLNISQLRVELSPDD